MLPLIIKQTKPTQQILRTSGSSENFSAQGPAAPCFQHPPGGQCPPACPLQSAPSTGGGSQVPSHPQPSSQDLGSFLFKISDLVKSHRAHIPSQNKTL